MPRFKGIASHGGLELQCIPGMLAAEFVHCGDRDDTTVMEILANQKVRAMPMVGSRHGRRGGAVMRRAGYSLARMSGMLDLSRDEKAKHFLPRWLRDAPT